MIYVAEHNGAIRYSTSPIRMWANCRGACLTRVTRGGGFTVFEMIRVFGLPNCLKYRQDRTGD